jgi:hypothetical protein
MSIGTIMLLHTNVRAKHKPVCEASLNNNITQHIKVQNNILDYPDTVEAAYYDHFGTRAF